MNNGESIVDAIKDLRKRVEALENPPQPSEDEPKEPTKKQKPIKG